MTKPTKTTWSVTADHWNPDMVFEAIDTELGTPLTLEQAAEARIEVDDSDDKHLRVTIDSLELKGVWHVREVTEGGYGDAGTDGHTFFEIVTPDAYEEEPWDTQT